MGELSSGVRVVKWGCYTDVVVLTEYFRLDKDDPRGCCPVLVRLLQTIFIYAFLRHKSPVVYYSSSGACQHDCQCFVSYIIVIKLYFRIHIIYRILLALSPILSSIHSFTCRLIRSLPHSLVHSVTVYFISPPPLSLSLSLSLYIYLSISLSLSFIHSLAHSFGAKTIKKNPNSTQNKSQTYRAKQYEVTSFLSTDCELST